MKRSSYEILIGALAVFGLIAIIGVLYSGSGRNVSSGYDVTVLFQRIDGLSEGSEVRLSGLPVGRVVGEALDEHFRALVTLRINDGVALPLDTSAAIHTDGLLGPKYVELQPGGDDAIIAPGGRILYAQNAVVIQDLLELIVSEAKPAPGNKELEE